MTVFDAPDYRDHEQVVFVSDAATELKAIIAVHNTRRGPAFGGCRFWAYASEEDAIADALRLSRSMTYKSALARLPLGGGKCVVIGDAATVKTPELLRALGVAIEQLHGRYVTAEDVGVSPDDLRIVREATTHVAGLPETSGDPSPMTARGVFVGLELAARRQLGAETLDGVKVAVQGLGAVGRGLAERLHAAGAKLIVADIRPDAVQQAVVELNAEAVTTEEIFTVEADVFAPCALGAILNDETIHGLKAAVVAGSANNQLARAFHGEEIKKHNILYAPDYAINAGGIINIAHENRETGVYDAVAAAAAVDGIADTLAEIFDRAEAENLATSAVADAIAEERLNEA